MYRHQPRAPLGPKIDPPLLRTGSYDRFSSFETPPASDN
jgi:hypothetical protein